MSTRKDVVSDCTVLRHEMDRRTLLTHCFWGAGAATCGTFLSGWAMPARAATETQAVLDTTSGKIRGSVANGIKTFRGIPYGGPTEGTGRFMPPQKPKPWTGVRDALQNGPACLHVSGQPFDVTYADVEGGSFLYPMSENCLTLNVWAPAQDGGKRPVMVWFHGGGFTGGSALEPRYDGRNLARNGDVVVVGVNHRLNLFGFLYLGHLGQKYAASGSVGMLDCALSLQWVRDNIAAFGGDPGNVTIFGQSGGGQKVCTLLTMPAAKGLAHKAIIQSGANLAAKLREEAIQDTSLILNELGIAPNQVDKL